MKRHPPQVERLSRTTRVDARIHGGKAAGLAALRALPGIRVPPIALLPTTVLAQLFLDAFPQATWKQRAEQLMGPARLEVMAALAHHPVPPALLRQIGSAMRGHRVVIVRSSAVAEDGATTSLAGHFESIVCPAEPRPLSAALTACLASGVCVLMDLDSGPPLSRLKRALRGLALLVQPVVDGTRSGVVFSRSPVHKDAALVVASYGSCHAVVDGTLASDSWAVGDDDTVHAERLVAKYEMSVLCTTADAEIPGATIASPLGPVALHRAYTTCVAQARVPDALVHAPVLTDAQLLHVVDTARAVAKGLGYPVDVEWSFTDDTLWVLQARPITTDTAHLVDADVVHTYGIASPGIAAGPARILHSVLDVPSVQPGDVLCVVATDPDFMPALKKAAAVLSEDGSPLSHTAIVARELQIPCLTGVTGATSGAFFAGERLTVDAVHGRVQRAQRGARRADKAHAKLRSDGVARTVSALANGRGSSRTLTFSALAAAAKDQAPEADLEENALHALHAHLKRRFGLKVLRVAWDVLDDALAPVERDPTLVALRHTTAGWR